MSLFLHRVGSVVGRHRVATIVAWLLLLVVLFGLGSKLGSGYDDAFSIPGTDSQQGQDVLDARFPQTKGASGQLVLSVEHGSITSSVNASDAERIIDRVSHVSGVESVSDALKGDSRTVSDDGSAALATIQFRDAKPSTSVQDAVTAASDSSVGAVSAVAGGSAFSSTSDGGKTAELIGVLVALLVLVVSFGSLLAAGMPLLTALLGVGITGAAITLATSVGDISSTAPTIARMIGLAVGIDYALFILNRYRSTLADGVAPGEAMARALGTAGSAVVFAGITVMIALLGLSVANIPFLTVMGVAAAAAVAIAVLVALTLLPAVALLFGSALTPRPRRARRGRPARASRAGRVPRAWVRFVTRKPIVTVLVVVIGLGTCAVPLLSIDLALPDSGSQPASSPQRQAFDAIAADFGPGYNAPLIITADIISSTDPKGTVQTLQKKIAKVDGVVDVPTATPNEGGDTAYLRVIPKGSQSSAQTAALVQRIRAETPQLEKAAGVHDILVTGSAATAIDVSARLSGALLPFAAVVVGLSLVLLLLVFRSIAVPLKATLGYLLSVGAALGAVVAVFQWNWLGDSVTAGVAGPVVSFLPIIVMGVLFGLAMDYEMFLVSRMREHYAQHGDAQAAVREGFASSAPVVTAAALIMTSVFAAFVPSGSATVKPLAFGLAVGVFVDAFLVRMTLVPAVLALLGDRAWWMPRALDRALPSVDVEGEAILRRIELDADEAEYGPAAVRASALVLRDGDAPLDLVAARQTATVPLTATAGEARALAVALAGRQRPVSGRLAVGGFLVPEQREAVLRSVALVDLADRAVGADRTVADEIAAQARLAAPRPAGRRTVAASARSTLTHAAGMTAVPSLIVEDDEPMRLLRPGPWLLVHAAIATASGAPLVVVAGIDEVGDPAELSDLLAAVAALASLGVAVVAPASEDALAGVTPAPALAVGSAAPSPLSSPRLLTTPGTDSAR